MGCSCHGTIQLVTQSLCTRPIARAIIYHSRGEVCSQLVLMKYYENARRRLEFKEYYSYAQVLLVLSVPLP
jgi:hypothetical protein